jgi:hypothetical protein
MAIYLIDRLSNRAHAEATAMAISKKFNIAAHGRTSICLE